MRRRSTLLLFRPIRTFGGGWVILTSNLVFRFDCNGAKLNKNQHPMPLWGFYSNTIISNILLSVSSITASSTFPAFTGSSSIPSSLSLGQLPGLRATFNNVHRQTHVINKSADFQQRFKKSDQIETQCIRRSQSDRKRNPHLIESGGTKERLSNNI